MRDSLRKTPNVTPIETEKRHKTEGKVPGYSSSSLDSSSSSLFPFFVSSFESSTLALSFLAS